MSRNIRRILACLTGLGLAVGTARAANEVTVVISGTGSGRPATILFDAGAAINAANGLPTIETTDTLVNIYSTDSLASIGRVTFATASGSRGDLGVFLGIGSFPTIPNPLTARGTDWAGISALPSNLVGKVNLAGAITGDLTGSISVDRIFRLEIGDEIQAAIEATGSGSAIRRINFGRSTSAGTITATNGDALALQSMVSTGTVAGAISALSGKIESIAAAGDIVISASPGIAARDGIDSIEARDLDAAIVANANSGAGGMRSLVTHRSFTGSVEASSLTAVDNEPTTPVIDLTGCSLSSGQGFSIAGDVTGSIVGRSGTDFGDVLIGGTMYGWLAQGDARAACEWVARAGPRDVQCMSVAVWAHAGVIAADAPGVD